MKKLCIAVCIFTSYLHGMNNRTIGEEVPAILESVENSFDMKICSDYGYYSYSFYEEEGAYTKLATQLKNFKTQFSQEPSYKEQVALLRKRLLEEYPAQLQAIKDDRGSEAVVKGYCTIAFGILTCGFAGLSYYYGTQSNTYGQKALRAGGWLVGSIISGFITREFLDGYHISSSKASAWGDRIEKFQLRYVPLIIEHLPETSTK
ncbi:MAG: hypothetical protein WCE21_03045 [Candidatus Babeliales bacterium]